MKLIKAGNAFQNCLADNKQNGLTLYKKLTSSFNEGQNPIFKNFCCDDSICSQAASNNCSSSQTYFDCKHFYSSSNCPGPGNICQPAITTVAICSSSNCLGIVINNKSPEIKSDFFSCNNTNSLSKTYLFNYLNTLEAKGYEKGYSTNDLTNCPNSICNNLDFCGWDNNVTICHAKDSLGNACFETIPSNWSGPADKNPNTYIYIPTQTNVLPSLNPTNSQLPINDDHLIEKIAIPVGSLTGTGIISGLTYYYCKKRRRMKENNNDQTKELPSQKLELEDNEIIGNEQLSPAPIRYLENLNYHSNAGPSQLLNNPHVDYIEAIEVRNPQWISTRNPEWRGN